MFSLCPPWSVLAIAWRGTVRLSNACMFKIDFCKFRNYGKSQHFPSIFLNDSVNTKQSICIWCIVYVFGVFDEISVFDIGNKNNKCMSEKSGGLMHLYLIHMRRKTLEEQYN